MKCLVLPLLCSLLPVTCVMVLNYTLGGSVHCQCYSCDSHQRMRTCQKWSSCHGCLLCQAWFHTNAGVTDSTRQALLRQKRAEPMAQSGPFHQELVMDYRITGPGDTLQLFTIRNRGERLACQVCLVIICVCVSPLCIYGRHTERAFLSKTKQCAVGAFLSKAQVDFEAVAQCFLFTLCVL